LYDIEGGQWWKMVVFEARLSNWTSTGREFLNSVQKLLVVDFFGLDARCDEFGRKLCLKRKARRKMSMYPNFVAV